jgi:hypothetical protein
MSMGLWTGSTGVGSCVHGLHYMPVVDSVICVQDLSPRRGILASNLGRSSLIRWLGWLAPTGGGAGSHSRRRATAERGGSPEFRFSRATVVGFRWGLLLWDHNDEGNLIRLTLIDGGWQWSAATVRQLGWCLVTVRVASGEASAPSTCAKASSSSLLASRPVNCPERRQKTRIWWLPRVRRVLELWPKIRTIGSAIYRGF